jgi:hypothetical protein
VGLSLIGLTLLGVGEPTLVINEVAWAGTAASASDEWIELYNASDFPIALDGWRLVFGATVIPLASPGESTIEARTAELLPGRYLLLERTDDTTVSDLPADILYKGLLSNAGVDLELIAPTGEVVDRLSAAEGWPAGFSADGEIPYGTLERVDPTATEPAWRSNDGVHRNGSDADGEPLNGTPKAENAATARAARAPRVELIDPLPEETAGLVILTWSAVDPDGDDSALRIAIELSSDGGDTWTSLASRLANAGSYAWNTTPHPNGTSYRIRIRASDADGYETIASSDVFAITNP